MSKKAPCFPKLASLQVFSNLDFTGYYDTSAIKLDVKGLTQETSSLKTSHSSVFMDEAPFGLYNDNTDKNRL